MATIRLRQALTDLDSQVRSCVSLPNEVATYRRPAARGGRALPPHLMQQIAELACLRMCLAWEIFLEETFVRYMCGATSPSGWGPVRYVTPKHLDHAREIASGGKDYVSWVVAQQVIDRANLYFEKGDPYTSALLPALLDLDDLRAVRNRIAHSSQSAREKFENMLRRRRGYVPRGMGPGRFVLGVLPGGVSYLEDTGQRLSALASQVVR